jgi:serine/threonine protein kinase
MGAEAAALLTNLAGTWLGSFELIRLLGVGGMGAVYLAKDSILRRDVAIKLIARGSEDTDPERRDRILREARAAARLVHPSVVQIFQIGEDSSYRFIAMEYVQGMTTAQMAKGHGGRLPEQFGIEKMREAADALKLAGSFGICHRDIKPANLLLTSSGALKIADFGLAAEVEGGETIGPGCASQLEGTPFYMSPEQWSGGPIFPASDIYSLGCTIYHLLTGSTPYPARDLISCFGAHCLSPIPDPKIAMPDMDPLLADLLKRCMAKRPPDRPTAAQIVELLDDMLVLRRSAVRARSAVEQSSPPPASAGSGPPSQGLSGFPSQRPSGFPSQRPSGFPSQRPSVPSPGASTAPPGEISQGTYQALFGLTGYPFSDVRKPSSFWDAGTHALALHTLATQISAGKRPVMLLGPPGSGRTFVCEMLRHKFSGIQVSSIEPQLLFGARLLVSLCRQLGIPGVSPGASQEVLIHILLEHMLPPHRPDGIAVVVIDGLDPSDRDLLFELDDILCSAPGGRLSMVLVGPDDLPAGLAESGAPPSLCWDLQPITLRGLTQQEMAEYIDFRVRAIGRSRTGLDLDVASLQLLHARTGGIPRLINVYCHNALTIAALRQERAVRFSTLRVAMKSNTYLTPDGALALLERWSTPPLS